MRLPVLADPMAPAAAPLEASGPRSISAVRVLRISITDRCNYRCVYCMPADGVRWLPREQILNFEEIADVVRAAVEIHGIRRFKLTGGEPTVRHGLLDLVAMLRRIPGVDDLSLTTNGQRLFDLAGPLREAGLHRLTISIDSLDEQRFKRITRTGDLPTVLRGLDRAEDVGFDAIKINTVAMHGTNDDEFPDFARLTRRRPLTVRFIEYMPLGDAALMHGDLPDADAGRAIDLDAPAGGSRRIDASERGPAGGCGAQDRGAGAFIAEAEIRDRIQRSCGPLLPVDRASESGVGPATVYRLASAHPRGRIGFISAMSAPFCSTCNRLRLTADGVLRSCLFEGGEVDVRTILRSHAEAQQRRRAIAVAMADCVTLKPTVHSGRGNQQMSRIGG